jgi:ribosomal protein S18 acetylase RimI-like enzyme
MYVPISGAPTALRSGVVEFRDAAADDGPFLAEMLAVAADWRPQTRLRSADEILDEPEFARYIAAWPRPGDCGVIAEVGGPVGAAWFRFLPQLEPGYGYVADDIPEITIGVRQRYRRRGIGGALLRRLVERARDADLHAVSLSVEEDNPAMRLYERIGFIPEGHADGAATMLLHLAR